MTTQAPTLTLDTFFNDRSPALAALRNGEVGFPGFEMNLIDMPNVIVPFRRLCRELEFDVSELAVVAYFVARRFDLPLTAIPVFPFTSVSDGDGIFVNQRAGVRTARDLEGKKVGLRAYTVTPHVWQRAYLQQQGVDLSKVTWVSNDEEHSLAFHAAAPANVEYKVGANLQTMLASGETAAGLMVPVPNDPDVKQLYPDARADGIETFKREGIYRLGHLVVVNNRVLEHSPWVLEAAYEGFKASKQAWLAQQGDIEPWDDIMPCGLTQTRKSIERLVQYSYEQGVIDRIMDVDELFPGNLD